ncbi:hypothetical protein HYT84_04030 [Candidatus Micrarchaeota archaeon]|nr:hypothetical protein [Candidatus Micrarchaeota archaeon]
MGGPSVIMSKEEENLYKAGRTAVVNMQLDIPRFYAANFPPQFQDVPAALSRTLGELAKTNPDAILAANFFHSLVDQTIKAKQALGKLEKELTPLLNNPKLHEKDRQFLKETLEKARTNYKQFEEYALVTVAKVQTESTLKQADYQAQKFFISCENLTVLSKVAAEVVAAKDKSESVVSFTYEQLRKRRAVVRLMEEDESAKKGIIKALEEVERDVTMQIRSFRSILQESVLTRFQEDKETGKLVIDQSNCALVGAVLTFPKRMEAIWKAADAIAWTSIFKDDSFLNEQALHDPKKLAQIRGYLNFLIESIEQQRKMTTEMKVPVLDSQNRPTTRDKLLLPDNAASKLNKEYEELKIALRSVLQAIDEIYTNPSSRSSAFITGSVTRAEAEKSYLFDIGVIQRRMNLAITKNKMLTEEVGSVVGEYFNSYMDKIAGTGIWEKIQEPVGDFAVIAMMTLHPTPYTIGFGSAYFAARGAMDLTKEYATTGQVSFSGVAMAVAGLAGLGGTVFKIVNTARTAALMARGAQLDLGSALTSQKIMLGFELTSSFSGAYLFGEGAVGAVKSTAHGFKYGWTADNITNLFTSGVFLGLGVKGIKNSPAEIAKVVSIITELKAARPVVMPKEFAPRLEPVNVGQMGSMGGNIKGRLYREMPVEQIGEALIKAPNEDAPIGSVGNRATAKQALGYLEQVYRTEPKRKDAAQKELENIRDNAADVGLRAYARQILKSPGPVIAKLAAATTVAPQASAQKPTESQPTTAEPKSSETTKPTTPGPTKILPTKKPEPTQPGVTQPGVTRPGVTKILPTEVAPTMGTSQKPTGPAIKTTAPLKTAPPKTTPSKPTPKSAPKEVSKSPEKTVRPAEFLEQSSKQQSDVIQKLRSEGHHDIAARLDELRAMPALEKSLGITEGLLSSIYKSAPDLKTARELALQAVGSKLGVKLNLNPELSPAHYTNAFSNLYNMLGSGNLVANALKAPGISPGSKVTNIKYMNGLVGAYEVTIKTPRGDTTLFAKAQDLRADHLGSELSKAAGIPAPQIFTEVGGKSLTFKTSSGDSRLYGLIQNIGDFKGNITVEGKSMPVSTITAAPIDHIKYNKQLDKAVTDNSALFWEELGYAQTGFVRSGLWDAHEGNAFAMLLKISEADAAFLTRKGHKVFTVGGSPAILKVGRIDTDSGGHFLAKKGPDGQYDFSSLYRRYGGEDLRRIISGSATRSGRTVQDVANSVYPHMKEGARRWQREVGNTPAFSQQVPKLLTEHNGNPVGIGHTMSESKIAAVNAASPSKPAILLEGPFNGRPHQPVNTPDGRSHLNAPEAIDSFRALNQIPVDTIWNGVQQETTKALERNPNTRATQPGKAVGAGKK